MTAQEVLSDIERRFNCTAGIPHARSQTGELYREFLVGPAKTEVAAAALLLAAVDKYATGRSGVLYWRVQPEIELRSGEWRGYIRLLISAEPQQQTLAEWKSQNPDTDRHLARMRAGHTAQQGCAA